MIQNPRPHLVRRIAFVGNYLPRQCGIATFTTDLCESIAAEFPEASCLAVPVTDVETGYDYPARVRFELTEDDVDSYRRAADFLNTNNVHMVSLQHEYGIFGGRAGEHILALLRDLRMPVVSTFHTVLEQPDADQLRVLREVAALSDRLVVMSERGRRFLQDIYGVPGDKIDLIPHGIPDVPFVDPSFHKDLFGVEGKTVLLSFGLLSPNKGIENVIAALPAILEEHPNVVYMVVGATHPHVLREDGESYRLFLQRLAREKGVDGSVIFHNRFVAAEELNQFIGAADIYITPYLEPRQIVSGTLAYALGAGKAVVSTPYWYAEEMLANERGVLVPFRDPEALAREVNGLLDDEAHRHAMRKRAYLYGRRMIWPEVAHRYMESFDRARAERLHFAKSEPAVKPMDRRPAELPPLDLSHLERMTDQTGILQHATFSIPNYGEGYTTDDNARALLVSTLLEQVGEPKAPELGARYLAFLSYAYNRDERCFRNFMDYRRNWLEERGSEDSQGRALWALGTVLNRTSSSALSNMAARLFEQSLPGALSTRSPRTWAFAIMGIHEYLQRFQGDRRARRVLEQLGGRLIGLYRRNFTPDWPWFEPVLTYCNASLPHAVLLYGESASDREALEAGMCSLEWLMRLQTAEGDSHFVPIGSNGFYPQGGERARFDQQPVEAQATVSACLQAYRVTGEALWKEKARSVFDWFLGRNDLRLPLYDPTTGGCRDGLHPDRPNENQGAESTLAFLQALLEQRLAENTIPSGGYPFDEQPAIAALPTPQP